MSEIVLKRANVVKRVDSEDKAKALEAKGFVRTDGRTVINVNSDAEAAELRSQLIKAGEIIKTADARRGELEKELSYTKEQLSEAEEKIRDLETEFSGTKEQLEAAEGRIRTLETELSGTKEQLEAAVEKNKDTAKKGK